MSEEHHHHGHQIHTGGALPEEQMHSGYHSEALLALQEEQSKALDQKVLATS